MPPRNAVRAPGLQGKPCIHARAVCVCVKDDRISPLRGTLFCEGRWYPKARQAFGAGITVCPRRGRPLPGRNAVYQCSGLLCLRRKALYQRTFFLLFAKKCLLSTLWGPRTPSGVRAARAAQPRFTRGVSKARVVQAPPPVQCVRSRCAFVVLGRWQGGTRAMARCRAYAGKVSRPCLRRAVCLRAKKSALCSALFCVVE